MFTSKFGKESVNIHPRMFFPSATASAKAAVVTLLLIFGISAKGAVSDAAPAVSTPNAAKPAPAEATGAAAKPAEPVVDAKEIKRPDFTLSYPTGWTEDTQARDYDPNGNFTLFSQKNSSVQFVILNKTEDPKKVVDNAVKKIDNVQITTLSRTSLPNWGKSAYKGVGQHLKGKIVDSFPGGIKIFCFSSPKHNVLVIETYFSDDLKDVQADIDFISGNFKMNN